MSDPTFIPDGYTRDGYIKPSPGIHGALHFEYRPLLPDERDALARQAGKRSADEFGALTRKMLMKQLLSWDNQHQGKKLPIDNDSLRRLPPNLYGRLENIVSGYSASDLQEDQAPEQVDDFIASLDKQDPGQAQSEADLKN